MPHPDSTRIALAAVLGLVAAGGDLLGGYFVVYRNWERRNLQYFVALGAGYMLAVAFLDVIPESVRLAGDSAFVVILIGYFLIHLFEHTIAPHLHFREETHHEAVRHRPGACDRAIRHQRSPRHDFRFERRGPWHNVPH